MRSDHIATRLVATGTVQNRPCRLKGIYYLGGAAAGSIAVDDDGTTRGTFDIGANASGYINLAMADMLFLKLLHATLTGVTSATFITD